MPAVPRALVDRLVTPLARDCRRRWFTDPPLQHKHGLRATYVGAVLLTTSMRAVQEVTLDQRG